MCVAALDATCAHCSARESWDFHRKQRPLGPFQPRRAAIPPNQPAVASVLTPLAACLTARLMVLAWAADDPVRLVTPCEVCSP